MNVNNAINNAINMENLNHASAIDSIKGNTTQKPSFEDYLKNTIQDVNSIQIEAEKQSSLLATGQAENVHDVTIAASKAKISLDLTMAVRNKVVEAYKEIMRMQV